MIQTFTSLVLIFFPATGPHFYLLLIFEFRRYFRLSFCLNPVSLLCRIAKSSVLSMETLLR